MGSRWRPIRLPSGGYGENRWSRVGGIGRVQGSVSGVTLGDAFASTLEAARVGDEGALERLYRDTAPLVLGYARANGSRDPEDVAQEVFVALVTGLRGFRGDERSFRSWLLTITHRRLVDDLRRRGRRPMAAADDSALAERPAPGSVAGDALARLDAAGVLEAIDSLTDDQRAVLLLRTLADLPIADIAVVVGKPESAVKALLRRAFAALNRRLATEAAEGDDR